MFNQAAWHLLVITPYLSGWWLET